MVKITDGEMCSKYEYMKVMTILNWTEIVIAQTLFSLEKQVPCIWGKHKFCVFLVKTVYLTAIIKWKLQHRGWRFLQAGNFVTYGRKCYIYISIYIYIYIFSRIDEITYLHFDLCTRSKTLLTAFVNNCITVCQKKPTKQRIKQNPTGIRSAFAVCNLNC